MAIAFVDGAMHELDVPGSNVGVMCWGMLQIIARN